MGVDLDKAVKHAKIQYEKENGSGKDSQNNPRMKKPALPPVLDSKPGDTEN